MIFLTVFQQSHTIPYHIFLVNFCFVLKLVLDCLVSVKVVVRQWLLPAPMLNIVNGRNMTIILSLGSLIVWLFTRKSDDTTIICSLDRHRCVQRLIPSDFCNYRQLLNSSEPNWTRAKANRHHFSGQHWLDNCWQRSPLHTRVSFLTSVGSKGSNRHIRITAWSQFRAQLRSGGGLGGWWVGALLLLLVAGSTP